MSDRTPITLCCLLWAREGQERAMSAYEDSVLVLVAEHGGQVVHRVVGEGADGNPHEVQMYSFPDQAAIDAYVADPRRVALADVRERVVARTELFEVEVR